MQELTSEYNMNNYREAIKACELVTYSLEGYWEFSSTTYIRDSAQNERIASIRKRSHKDFNSGWRKLAKL